jgi:hypothetical protein
MFRCLSPSLVCGGLIAALLLPICSRCAEPATAEQIAIRPLSLLKPVSLKLDRCQPRDWAPEFGKQTGTDISISERDLMTEGVTLSSEGFVTEDVAPLDAALWRSCLRHGVVPILWVYDHDARTGITKIEITTWSAARNDTTQFPITERDAAVVAALLRDPKGHMRIKAAETLANFGAAAESQLPALKACLDDPQTADWVRSEVRRAMTTIEQAAAASHK